MRQELVNHFTWLANHISQCNEYKGWDAEYKIKELEEGKVDISEYIKE